MSATSTTLAAACGANDASINVTSATGAAVGQLWRVDSEWMVQTAAAISTTIPVRRGGQNGSTQVAHNILAPVVNCLPSDSPNAGPAAILNPAMWEKQITSVGANTTYTAATLPTCNTLTIITKATACAIVIVGPSALVDGLEWTILSSTAAAHTCTYVAGWNADTTASDVGTFAATKGNSMTMIACKGLWHLKSVYGVTVA